MTDTDWAAWSRDAVAQMNARNADWPARHHIKDAPYRWDLDSSTIWFRHAAGEVAATLCLVGTVCATEGTFLWSWANDHVPARARAGIDEVRMFGEKHDLGLLKDAEVGGGHAQALELLAIAGRILDADGVFIDKTGDLTLYFTLTGFRREQGEGAG